MAKKVKRRRIYGMVFYEGPSLLDGLPIVGIATIRSKNGKTGNLVQTWILRSDVHPLTAVNTGADASICGNCPLRGEAKGDSNKGRGCYVIVYTAPAQVFRSYKAGRYPRLEPNHARRFAGRGLRKGSYGDPAAIPQECWDMLASYCTGKADPGYTHQWREFPEWRRRVMASTHSICESEIAWSEGWRTYRTVGSVEEKTEREVVCPASEEGGRKATCETCGLCDGKHDDDDTRKSVVIVGHGRAGKPAIIRRVALQMA
jgi:hypothetical protein